MESSSKHYSEDAQGRERTIAELEDRIRVLENELRLKQGQAEDSQQLMRYILDQARDEASLVCPDGRFYYVNDVKCRSLGYTREELLSMHVWDVEPDMTEEKWASVWRDIRDHGFKMFETWHRTKHGRIFQTEVWATYFDFHGCEYLCAFVRDITERKGAEEALRASEARYRELVENANSIILRFDMQGNLTFFNEYAEKLFGYSRNEALGRNVVGTIVPSAESTGRDLNDMLEDMKRYPERYRSNVNENVCKNGDRVWIAWTNRAIRDGHGNVVEILSVGNDVTEHKRTEEALRESEERFRVLADNIPVLAWVADADGRISWFNKQCYDYTSLTLEELQDVGWQKVHHPDYVKAATDVWRSVIETGQPQDNVLPLRGKDGSYRWFLTRSRPIRNEDGTITRWFGTQTDITEQKRAEEALRESERNLARAQAISHIGNWYIDPATDVGSGSDEFFRILGVPRREELSFSEFTRLVHPDDRHMARAYFEETKQMRQQKSFDFRIVRPDGEERTIHLDGELTVDGEGRPRMFGTMQDITERKRAEGELANAKAQAELYVDLMGHDINNFNLVARGYLELIDGMVGDEKLKELVSKPMEAIDGSSRLIRNVQKLQRARSGGNQVEVLDLGALVGEVAWQFKSLSGDMSVNITCDAVKGVRVRANELLRDVFVNLIGNAIKHSAVPAYISIRVVPEEKDGRGHCRVIIDDNGPGVPDDMKEKIFNRLSRGNTKAKGNGLGLYLVKSLVESYGGRVWVEDRVKGDPTKGARFVVMLPAM